jgi:hypothetical protein
MRKTVKKIDSLLMILATILLLDADDPKDRKAWKRG